MTTATEQSGNRLEHYPVTFFAVTMGMAGLALAIGAFEKAYGLTSAVSGIAFGVAMILFGVIVLGYLLKILRHWKSVVGEWKHPVRLAFFPAISISLMLLATACLQHLPVIAEGAWLLGMALQGVLTIAVISGWVGARAFPHVTLSPAWFIPAVGNVIVPLAGAPLGYIELSWYFMSVGLLFWIVLLTLVMNRLFFHEPLPGKLQPALVILIAPPAVAFTAWIGLVGEVDIFARFLLNVAYVFTLIVAVQLPRIIKLQFSLSHWALSFPIAAAAIASFKFAGATGSQVHNIFGVVLLAALVVIIAGLLWRTFGAIKAGKVCQPE
ncbi:MAG: SLAC1 anion channel family protein [Rhodobacterales bacterium]|nr:SLAC1 anion channel family protein [Rhodobacterales bacterium]